MMQIGGLAGAASQEMLLGNLVDVVPRGHSLQEMVCDLYHTGMG